MPGPSSSIVRTRRSSSVRLVEDHRRLRPLAGVVEQVAQHLVEVLALAANDVLRRDIEANREPALGVQALERAHQPFGRSRDRAADGGVGARAGGARLGQVVLDLAPHPLDLLFDRRRELGLPRLPRPLGLLREDGERRLEAVREIPRLRARSRHALLALGEQRVQVLDERLDLRRILAFDPGLPAVAQCRHPRAQPRERGHPHPYGGERGDQQPERPGGPSSGNARRYRGTVGGRGAG